MSLISAANIARGCGLTSVTFHRYLDVDSENHGHDAHLAWQPDTVRLRPQIRADLTWEMWDAIRDHVRLFGDPADLLYAPWILRPAGSGDTRVTILEPVDETTHLASGDAA